MHGEGVGDPHKAAEGRFLERTYPLTAVWIAPDERLEGQLQVAVVRWRSFRTVRSHELANEPRQFPAASGSAV